MDVEVKRGPDPDAVLLARLIDALIDQMQNNTVTADKAREKAWKEHGEAWRRVRAEH